MQPIFPARTAVLSSEDPFAWGVEIYQYDATRRQDNPVMHVLGEAW